MWAHSLSHTTPFAHVCLLETSAAPRMIRLLIGAFLFSSFCLTESHGQQRPTIHTFYDEKDNYTSDEDLLIFWKEAWIESGWNPVVLIASSENSNKYEAMASAGGGWYCGCDVFPLFPQNETSMVIQNDDSLTLHQAVAPTLMAGSALAWRRMATALESHRHLTLIEQGGKFWTDTLALVDFSYNNSFPLRIQRNVLDKVEYPVDYCLSRPARSKWFVQVGMLQLQRSRSIPANLRLPKHRVTVAREWLAQWKACRQTHTQTE